MVFLSPPISEQQMQRKLPTQTRRTMKVYPLTTQTLTMKPSSHPTLHITPKSPMVWAVLTWHSYNSIHLTGWRHSLLLRDFGVYFWPWFLHFQSAVIIKMSFKTVLQGQLLLSKLRVLFSNLVSIYNLFINWCTNLTDLGYHLKYEKGMLTLVWVGCPCNFFDLIGVFKVAG